jgi:hypothetical protein
MRTNLISRIVSDPVEARNRVPGPTTFYSPWKCRDGSANDPNSSSDGYATGRVIFVLRQEEGSVKPPASSLGIDEKPTPRFFVRMLIREPLLERRVLGRLAQCGAMRAIDR